MAHHEHKINFNPNRAIHECEECPATFSNHWIIPYNDIKPIVEAINRLLGNAQEDEELDETKNGSLCTRVC